MDATSEMSALVQTAKQLVLLAETLERRSSAAATQHEQAAATLGRAVALVRGDVERLVQASGSQVAHAARAAVEASLMDSAGRFEQASATATTKIQGAANALDAGIDRVRGRLARQMIWAYAAIVGAMVLLIAGGGIVLWMEWQAYGDARARTASANVSAETAAAFAQVGMTSCGGRPCVRLDPKAPRWGDKGQYVLVDVKRSE